MFGTLSGGVAFGDVALPWYMRQGDQLLASTRGQLYDHFALSVTDQWSGPASTSARGVQLHKPPLARNMAKIA